MKKFGHLRNKKGFSLVELIIVVAIMVALVAVMAPTMTKYIAKARNAAMYDAAEQCMTYAKSCFGMNLTGKGSIQVGVEPESHKITVTFVKEDPSDIGLSYKSDSGEEGIEAFKKDLNFREGITSQSDKVYLIRIKTDDVVLNSQEVEFYIEESEVSEET